MRGQRGFLILATIGLLVQTEVGWADEKTEILALIQQLGSPRFAEREEAERILLHKDLAVPHIKLASVRNATPEVRARCTRILEKRRADAREDVSRELNEMVHR